MSPRANRLWAIVLAAGDEQGNLQCYGHQSVLQHTVARVEQLIPRERILVNVVQNGCGWIEPETAGAGLSTAIYVAGAATLWEMVRQTQPELYWDFMHLRRVCDQPHAADVTAGIYAFLPSQSRLDFWSAVCRQLPRRLRVCPIPAVERRQEL